MIYRAEAVPVQRSRGLVSKPASLTLTSRSQGPPSALTTSTSPAQGTASF